MAEFTFENATTENDDWLKQLKASVEDKMLHDILEAQHKLEERGGPGSGDFGHEGRPGEVGGSAGGGGGTIKSYTSNINIWGDKKISTKKLQTEISKAFARHPEKAMELVETVKVFTTKEAWEDELQRLGIPILLGSKYGGVGGYWHPGYSVVGIPCFGESSDINDQRQAKLYFDHEIGHAIWEHSENQKSWSKAYNDRITFDRRTAYAYKNDEEGFCETYASMMSSGWVGGYFKNVPSWHVAETVIGDVK